MFNFFRRKKPAAAPSPARKSTGPPPLPGKAGSETKGLQTHGLVFATSLLPHFWKESRADLWKMMGDDSLSEGVTGLWLAAGMTVPDQLRQSDLSEFAWGTQVHRNWRLALFQLPPVVYPFDVRFCLTAFGPLDSEDDAAWESAPMRLFFQQAALGWMELKEWRDGEIIDHGASTAETVSDFTNEAWRRLSGSNDLVNISQLSGMASEMDAAIARARREIGGVLARFQAGEFEQFGIKAPVTDGEHTEHFWLENVRFEDGQFVGQIDAEPRTVTGVTTGQEIRLAPAEISDYSALKDGRIHGYHTVRVLLPTMPPAHAEKLRAVLAEVEG